MWLDEQEPGSVVYACLGSFDRLTTPQLIELALGLEGSKRPFVWVIKGGRKAGEIEKWVEENRFEERTKGRGLLIRGWAPQVLILWHRAVGAFLTHCGWNSTLEGMCAGVPMLTWPMFAEQFLNEKLVVQVLDIGISVGAQGVRPLFEEDKCKELVEREAIKDAVEKVMGERIHGEERRKRARVLGDMAKKAIEEGGSSYLNTRLLIQDVMKLVNHKDSTQKHSRFPLPNSPISHHSHPPPPPPPAESDPSPPQTHRHSYPQPPPLELFHLAELQLTSNSDSEAVPQEFLILMLQAVPQEWDQPLMQSLAEKFQFQHVRFFPEGTQINPLDNHREPTFQCSVEKVPRVAMFEKKQPTILNYEGLPPPKQRPSITSYARVSELENALNLLPPLELFE
ncbi:hypothetical protein TEA_002911 [Camellia sinensis var. sinensis]|uniref:Uncharacterized protein n=1 Tax=Camellia sinensis var. sinensis TaxID=542762 RepID=A0A4S4DJT4_CAMSN|nr:hypothetical protein TEA_002911 [Camellia sinensis var. sinensis]